jgi:hypothetical protein
MKILRFALIAAAALAAVLLVVVDLAFSSDMQTLVVRRLLAARPWMHASVGRVAVGFKHVRIEDLRVERGGILLAVPAIDADMPVLPAIWNHDLRIRSLSARGWTLDASHAPLGPAGRVVASESFASPGIELLGGALSIHRSLPTRFHGFDLSEIPAWGPLDVQGTVVLPAGGKAPSGRNTVAVDLTGNPTATGAAYSMDLTGGGVRFAELRAHWTEATRRFAGRWKIELTVSGKDPISTKGEGSFEAAPTGLHIAGRFAAGAAGLANVLLPRDTAAATNISAQFDLVVHEGAWRVNQLAAELDEGRPVLRVTALQSFEINPATRKVSLADPAMDLARISARGVPLLWFRHWIPYIGLSGGSLSGDLVATSRGGGLDLRTQAPLSIAGFSATRGGRNLVQGLDIFAAAAAEIRPGGWQVELSPLSVKAGAAQVLTLRAKLGRLAGDTQPLKFEGQIRSSVPALLTQLAARHAIGARGGNLNCTFTGTVSGGSEVAAELEAHIAVSGVESRDGQVPALAADLRADYESGRRLVIDIPIHIDHAGRASAFTFSGTLARTQAGVAVDLQASGSKLFIDDAKFLSAPLASAGIGERVWKGITGRLAFAVKRAIWPGNFEVGDLDGTLQFAPGSITIQDVQGTLDGGRVALDGVLSPGPARSDPPNFSGDARLEDFDFTPFFSAIDPNRRPTLEGKFDAIGRLTGTGLDLMNLPGKFQGEWHVTSKGGVIRALSTGIEVKPATPDRIDAIGQFIGSVADTVTFRKDVHNPDKRARALAEFSNAMTAIRYDRIDVALSRDASMNIAIGDFSLISPEIRLQGAGSVLAEPDTSLFEEPLELSLKLRVRGHTADLVRSAGLLEAGKDDLGYSGCTLTFDIGGTLARPDMSEFREALLKFVP